VDTHSKIDVVKVLVEFQDYLAPKLDTYEQAIYLYIFRHSRLIGNDEVVIGFKSARRKMSFGVGEGGKPMSEGTCYKKLTSLSKKECIEILDTVQYGTRIRLRLPNEIQGVIPKALTAIPVSLEEMDFFDDPNNRLFILKREKNKCFYCLRDIDASNYVMEHAISRPNGDNSYRNVVAACRNCNNRKGEDSAEDFLRKLHRSGYLGAEEFENRLEALLQLRTGHLKPDLTRLGSSS
jgi:HNH endonuclease